MYNIHFSVWFDVCKGIVNMGEKVRRKVLGKVVSGVDCLSNEINTSRFGNLSTYPIHEIRNVLVLRNGRGDKT